MRKTPSPTTSCPLRINLKMQPTGINRFLPLLGEGFTVRGRAGLSVEEFLCREVGIPADYLRDRVQTVFLNGKAIDDLASAVVGANSVLALSAAMPGLAGAVLRRGGFYAAMRRQISHEADVETHVEAEANITLKLFNMVARELGPELLERGILIPCLQLKDFIERQGRWGLVGCEGADVDGNPLGAADLPAVIPSSGQTLLTIQSRS